MNRLRESGSATPVIGTAAGQAAKRSVLKRAQRQQATSGSYRCTACKGRCDVEVTYTRVGTIQRSKGTCRTPGCIAWED